MTIRPLCEDTMQRTIKPAILLSALCALTACTTQSGLQDVAPVEADYPNFNIVPRGEIAQMTPEEEAAMLVNLINAQQSQPGLSPAELRLLAQRKARLALLARTHAKDTERLIEDR